MKSFRSEIENPEVEQDILELEKKIRLYKEGKVDEERFRSLRLARGVYGQRQPGVQMIRIKLPYGKMTVRQLRRIAQVSDTYSTGKLHITTRQDLQIHYVSLDVTPQLWAELEKDEVTLREACGNTVRNVTGSPLAGVDPEEPFDITPYAHAFFSYFLRNPVCQEMGRKFKVSFSSSEADDGFSFMHDLGFIPKILDGERGFKIMIGGGLGAQPSPALVAYEFLPADQIIPFAEAVLRIFDRHGERNKRFKARFKFLLKQLGLEEIFRLIEAEKLALPYQSYPIDLALEASPTMPEAYKIPEVQVSDEVAYHRWRQTNVVTQKQAGFVAVQLKVPLGDFTTETARALADLVAQYAGDDIRLSINQGIVLRYVKPAALPYLYQEFKRLGLAEAGFGSTADITACPGTDTCNLAISNSTTISEVFEEIVQREYPELLDNQDLVIKISGCMNACGQHSIAAIGFHGSSLKIKDQVAPALQVLLGGGRIGNGQAAFAEKVIKIPSRRGPDALRILLNDYEAEAEDGEYFHAYFRRQGKAYFYQLLKPVVEAPLKPEEFIDWGKIEEFLPEIGVGECAGVVIDLVSTLLYETEEKLAWAREAIIKEAFADSIYHSYAAFVQGAKAMLVAEGINTNTQAGIIQDVDLLLTRKEELKLETNFASLVYQIKTQTPGPDFAKAYLHQAQTFYELLTSQRSTFKQA
ncbi:MAG: nitrite/sulfite reductase [Bacteroidota bacterium]